MVKLRYFIAIFLSIVACVAQAQTEEQLRKALQKSTDKTSHLQARLHLLSFLEQTNKATWIKELELIEEQSLAYPKKMIKISLLYVS